MAPEFVRKIGIRRAMKALRKTYPNKWVFADYIIPLLLSKSEQTRAIGMVIADVPDRILKRVSETRAMLEKFNWDLSEVESAEIAHDIATANEYNALYVAGNYGKYTCFISKNDQLGC